MGEQLRDILAALTRGGTPPWQLAEEMLPGLMEKAKASPGIASAARAFDPKTGAFQSALELESSADDILAGLRAAKGAPFPEKPLSGDFRAAQPGSATWRNLARSVATPWSGSVPVPTNPLAAAQSKVYPSWNGPFGAGGHVAPRTNLISSIPERQAAWEAFKARGAAAAAPAAEAIDDTIMRAASAAPAAAAEVAPAVEQAVASVAPQIERAVASAAPQAARGMLDHTLDGLRTLKLPWGRIAAGGAIGAGILGGAAKALSPWTGFIMPNEIDGSEALPLSDARAAEIEAGFHGNSPTPSIPQLKRGPHFDSNYFGTDSDFEMLSMYAPTATTAAAKMSPTADLMSPEDLMSLNGEEAMELPGAEPDADTDDAPPPVVPTPPEADTHTINRGDTLSGLLLAMGVSQADLPRVIGEIARGNQINPNNIVPGQQIDFAKRVAGPNYRWNGGPRPMPVGNHKISPPSSEPSGNIMAGLRSAPSNLAYDDVMGPGRRPPIGGGQYVANPSDLAIPLPQFRRKPF